MLNITSLSARYQITMLSEKDLPALLELCKGNPLFYEHCPPSPTSESLLSDLRALPKGKTMEDKYYLGFWMEGKLAAVLDLILRYPDEKTAFFGFFMLRSDLQGNGEGTVLVTEILDALSREFSHIRLCYAKGNPQSRHFWLKNGFVPTGRVISAGEYEIVLMQKSIQR